MKLKTETFTKLGRMRDQYVIGCTNESGNLKLIFLEEDYKMTMEKDFNIQSKYMEVGQNELAVVSTQNELIIIDADGNIKWIESITPNWGQNVQDILYNQDENVYYVITSNSFLQVVVENEVSVDKSELTRTVYYIKDFIY